MREFGILVHVRVIDHNHCSDNCILLHDGYCIAEGKTHDKRVDLKLDNNTETYSRTERCKKCDPSQ